MKVKLFVVPLGVVTLTFLLPATAVVRMVQFAATVVAVGVPVMVQDIPTVPPPGRVTFTVVAPVRPVPVRVAGNVVPRSAAVGLIEVSAGAVMVNVTLFVLPPGVVTLTFLLPVAAVDVSVQFAVTVVSVGVPVIAQDIPTVPPPGRVTFTAVEPASPLPFRITGTTEPRTPVFGLIEVSDGASTLNTG